MKNVIFIVVDALKYGLVGGKHNARPSHTPLIDDFFSEGMHFHNVHSVSFPTQFAMPGILAGQLPLSNGGYHLGISGRGETLADWYKRRGYKTIGITTDYHTSSCYGYGKGFDEYLELHDVAWHANAVWRNDLSYLAAKKKLLGMPDEAALYYAKKKLNAYIPYAVDFSRKRIEEQDGGKVAYAPQIDNWKFSKIEKLALEELHCLNRNGNEYAHKAMQGKSPWFNILPGLRLGPHYPDADYVLNRAMEILKGVSEPFFLYLHLTDVHGTLTEDLSGLGPISNDAIKFRRYPNSLNPYGRFEQRYEGQGERSDWRAVRFADYHLGHFLKKIKESSNKSETIVAMTADHGDHRAERYGYGAHYGVSDHLNFYDELTHVPFMVYDGKNSGDFFNLLSTEDTGMILKNIVKEDKYLSKIVSDSSREWVISEHATPGVCAIPFKPIKIAVRSNSKKLVYIDMPSQRFGKSEVIQAYDLNHDPLEKINMRLHVESDHEFRQLKEIAKERANVIRSHKEPCNVI
ncbi:sulfatase-like hydrolase/transferase [Aidingimonas halophila]|uniref:Sulfatase n=1 Tax=Aidingimonas halophila TaxID=574349 RepID=A0A1H2X2U1_9GAMM|nr:sulfatase-like hydrolase/transferase [Aidingimonas halophila]GHC27953.1 hypothetical protein GCM10008094_19540 [Aidingimonas halophila]SDW86589.1 Sulfatase [Aidingimonas halophila]